MRQGLKEYSDWPTYPQLYAKGELVGGLDIVKDMRQEDEPLALQLGLVESGQSSSAGSKVETVEERCSRLVSQSKVGQSGRVLF